MVDSVRCGMRSPREPQLRDQLRHAVVAGVLATIVESASLRLMVRGGQKPVFLPERMVQRLAGSVGYPVCDKSARHVGYLLRAGYGPAWGIAWTVLRRERASHHLPDTIVFGSVIWAFEVSVLPCVRATPPLRKWPRADVVSDLANCLVFAATFTLVTGLMSGPSDLSATRE